MQIDEAITGIEQILDAIDLDSYHLGTDKNRVDWATALVGLGNRLQAYGSHLAAKTDQDYSCSDATGLDMASWLAQQHQLTRRQALRIVQGGRQLTGLPALEQATLEGQVNLDQARVIARHLGVMRPDLTVELFDQAEQTLIQQAQEFDACYLDKIASHLVQQIDPARAEQAAEQKAAADHARATRGRFLRLTPSPDGQLLIDGALPAVEGEALRQLVVANARNCRDLYVKNKPAGLVEPGPAPSMLQWQADGLIMIVEQALAKGRVPRLGADRPRITVTIGYDKLLGDLRGARLVATGVRLEAHQARVLACDAGILPVVLGGGSQILDVGREERWVTPQLRRALDVRDGGCVFPGCDRKAEVSQAHHIRPWWDGGSTGLGNLVYLCSVHHPMVEPVRGAPPGARWEVRLRPDGLPETIPPYRVDPDRKPLLHQRHLIRLRT
ncbi:MAG: HNH endonuclease [Bifidobacteriaceae bacterium]|jgi:hypothetical protein|nr:HNH endonuclease [Bifidobacteriaceae bacterium]